MIETLSGRDGGGLNPGNNLHVSGLSHKVDTHDLEPTFTKVGRVRCGHAWTDTHAWTLLWTAEMPRHNPMIPGHTQSFSRDFEHRGVVVGGGFTKTTQPATMIVATAIMVEDMVVGVAMTVVAAMTTGRHT
ncbi:hypothetical protein OG21DRAFT_1489991 [Imleria badia]|nr:hypothetical protein OG21DRAFT_1489991 [Imleria badia]